MPCTCDGYPKPDLHNGPLADMLCKAMAEHEARGELSCFNEDQLAWWKEHKRRDKLRVEQDLRKTRTEAMRKAAIAKLTPFERALLGIEEP